MNNYSSQVFENRKSFYSVDLEPSSKFQSEMYLHMFYEDIHNSILPLSQDYSKRENYSVQLDPPNNNLEEMLKSIFNSDNFGLSQNVTDSIGNFISETARLLAYRGKIYYEINPAIQIEKSCEDVNKFKLFRLLQIPGNIYKFNKIYIQFIPKKFRSENILPFYIIPSKSIWELSIPNNLGGPKKHRRIMKSLNFAGLTIPEFVSKGMDKNIKNKDFIHNFGLPEFNFGEFNQIQKLAIASETSIWGWPIRNLLMDETLEFYQIYRQIRFSQALSILREYILVKINNLIEQRLSTSKLFFTDLLNYLDLKKIELDLIDGKISFEEAYSLIQI